MGAWILTFDGIVIVSCEKDIKRASWEDAAQG